MPNSDHKAYVGVIVACLIAIVLIVIFVPRIDAAEAAPDVPPCEPIGNAEGETLYYCESDYGPPCYWDPSPALGAGVMSCEW